MHIFISWSGPQSRVVASKLKEWLPDVLHFVDPWMSQHDIGSGERWASQIAGELDSTNFGIVCLTAHSLNAPWVLFEAGALAKSVEESRLVPLLIGIDFQHVQGPLAQFQGRKANREAVFKLLEDINKTAPEAAAVPADRLQRLFDLLWPDLERVLEEAETPERPAEEPAERQVAEVLDELVAAVRGMDARLARVEEGQELAVSGPRGHTRGPRVGRSELEGLVKLRHAALSWAEVNPEFADQAEHLSQVYLRLSGRGAPLAELQDVLDDLETLALAREDGVEQIQGPMLRAMVRAERRRVRKAVST